MTRVGKVLLPPVDVNLEKPNPIIIAEDCFNLLNIPIDRVKHILVKSVEKVFGGKPVRSHLPPVLSMQFLGFCFFSSHTMAA